MSTISFIKSSEEFNNYVKNNTYLIANFTATWCGPCQAIKPIIDSLYNDASYSKVEIVRIDLDSQKELASKYEITSIPTFLFFKNGQVVQTIKGATPTLQQSFESFKTQANADTSATERHSGASKEPVANSAIQKAIGQFIPKGYQILNEYVFSGDFEALNTVPLVKDNAIKDVFDLNKENTAIYSDADSQLLLYVPLTHISKVYSILIKTTKAIEVSETTTLDEDDLEEVQTPNLIKVWSNKLSILSFDDAVADSKAQHIEKLDVEDDQHWYEFKLKFVRFQSVQNLNIFFDGEDDDFHTIVEKIVIIGLGGDEKDHLNILEKLTGGEE